MDNQSKLLKTKKRKLKKTQQKNEKYLPVVVKIKKKCLRCKVDFNLDLTIKGHGNTINKIFNKKGV